MASWDSSKIAIPFVPSLHHLSSVKIAIRLFKEFDVKLLDTVFTEIKQKNAKTCDDTTEETWEYKRAKEELLAIPAHLRETVVRAVHGLGYATKRWDSAHSYLLDRSPNEHFCYRSDGSIDAVKTAQNLVLDENISMEKRFQIACMYCFEQSVRTLWGEMVASGNADSFDCRDNSMVRFWMRWLREGANVPWTLAATSYLDPISHPHLRRYARFSAFFPLLALEDRQKYLGSLKNISLDDFRFCLYALTKEEEEEIFLEGWFQCMFALHLCWPLQALFVETVEKLWSYLDETFFCRLLFHTLGWHERSKDFNYSEMLEYLWNRSSNDWREIARKYSGKIDSYFGSKKRKRSASNEIK